MSFSDSGGGTLALPSPTHAHQIDVTSAVRTLRRSMSRSPSKFLSRANSHASRNPNASLQASPQSPCRRFNATPQQKTLPGQTYSAPPITVPTSHQNPFTPFRPNVRLSLRSTKARTSPSRHMNRTRTSPRSPLKRALSAAPDAGNPVPSTTPCYSPERTGQENFAMLNTSPTLHKTLDRSEDLVGMDGEAASPVPQSPDDRTFNSENYLFGATGALKRSDATMNLDQPSQGSPVAKRRSLYGILALSQDEELNIFGSGSVGAVPEGFNIHEDAGSDYELFGAAGTPSQDPLPSPTPPASSPVPKRTSSLRKSTLQQRWGGERGSLGRRTGERHLAQLSAETSPVRHRPGLSSDQFVPPSHVPQDSPFASSNAAINPATNPSENKGHQPHPLSKTLTTSSSGNNLTEETPLYAPAPRVIERPRAHHPFSRSLPLNATRPTRPASDFEAGIATPSHSQLWVGAFHSTGLVSKVNRNPEEKDKKMGPPDTPCKKHSNPFATFPPPAGSAIKKRGNSRNSFGGVPSTPFNPAASRGPNTLGNTGNTGKGLSIFQRGSASRNARRGSVLSFDGDERGLFNEYPDLFSTPVEGEGPPTPTKNTLTSSLSNLSEQSIESPSANRSFPSLTSARPGVSQDSACKSTSEAPDESEDESDEALNASRRIAFADYGQSPSHRLSFPSLSRSKAQKGSLLPTPLTSPIDGSRTPQTPRESLLPLDTSRLSISHKTDLFQDNIPVPVTPTGGRDLRSSSLVTPINGRTANVDVEASLYSRFDRVEQVGTGEFSTVYRVTKCGDPSNAFAAHLTTTPGEYNRSPAKGQVYAVKKSKHPYTGPKQRETVMREANILQQLVHAEHVVQYIDSWEHNYHLYIQTEYCEEGTLKSFLDYTGMNARLDDFRIFKILQDLSLGLKEIHDAGFMHLDMKPANILITFEGVLKIGDFGLAQPCSTTNSVDIEGDAYYMAPEMLKGRIGPPADIFSLGLIILEAAANVELPKEGDSWIALRSGDLSEVPSLTWNPSSEISRDESGNPTEPLESLDFVKTHDAGNLFGSYKKSESLEPPDFMVNSQHPSSLDSIVQWMTAQDPENRPTVQQVLELEGMQWVAEHRAAPATVHEGNWGPIEGLPVAIAGSDSDTEMMDV